MRRPKLAAAPRTVVVDARCLQDPGFSTRGIGRQVTAVMHGFPRHRREKLVALTDPGLPPLSVDAASLFDAVAVNAYAARREAETLGRLTAYISTSPMTHDPLFNARFLDDPALAKVAIVYDFIPLRHPDKYLTTMAADLDYAVKLFWLSRHDRYVAISRSTADDIVTHLRAAPSAIAVSGSPVAESHIAGHTGNSLEGRMAILTVGGGDPRKSPETVIGAHARNKALQEAGVVLTVAGNYGPANKAAFEALAAADGGDPGLLRVPGEITDAELVKLYRAARVVVCPSVDEGFSIPVVEGMAAGALVLASDIPAHRELLPSADYLFPVGDTGRLSALLQQAVDSSDAVAAVLEAQDAVWSRFRVAHIAERFWAHALPAESSSPLAAPAIHHDAKPRIALLTPLPPAPSGVADYTQASCLELGKRAELHVFTETQHPGPVPGSAAVVPMSELPGMSSRYDRTIAVLGNSHFHVSILDHLERFGGASIAHDARMLGFYYMCRSPDAAVKLASRELRRSVTVQEVEGWTSDEGTLATTFLGDIAAASTPMMVHSPVTQAILRDRSGIEAAYLPFSIYRPFAANVLSPALRRAARKRLNLAEGEIVLATFGFVDRSKAPEDCLWAVEQLRRWGVQASLHFVGQNNPDQAYTADLLHAAARLGIADHVKFFPGYLDQATFSDYLVAADVAIQLRTYGLGGLSGALLDCAAAGLPCVTNQALFDAVMPPPAYTTAVPNQLSPILLAEHVVALLEQRGTKATETARREFCDTRSLARYADHLMAALGL